MSIPWLFISFVGGAIFGAAFSLASLIAGIKELPITLIMPKECDL